MVFPRTSWYYNHALSFMMNVGVAVLLTVDVGNSHTVLGLYKQDALHAVYRFPTRVSVTVAALKEQFYEVSQKTLSGIIIGSVVPALHVVYEQFCKQQFSLDPVWVDAAFVSDIPLLIDQPGELGADRLINAVAARHKYIGSLIVVDIGTAVTFCLLSAEGAYLGGAIALGAEVALTALHTHTAQLPLLSFAKPPMILGKNTVDGMLSGAYYGTASLLAGMVTRFKKLEGFEDATVVATGGLVSLMAADLTNVTAIEPNLTLDGLHLLYKKMLLDTV